jgi:hypothetical protein
VRVKHVTRRLQVRGCLLGRISRREHIQQQRYGRRPGLGRRKASSALYLTGTTGTDDSVMSDDWNRGLGSLN